MILKLDNWSVKCTPFKCKVQGAKCNILHFALFVLHFRLFNGEKAGQDRTFYKQFEFV